MSSQYVKVVGLLFIGYHRDIFYRYERIPFIFKLINLADWTAIIWLDSEFLSSVCFTFQSYFEIVFFSAIA